MRYWLVVCWLLVFSLPSCSRYEPPAMTPREQAALDRFALDDGIEVLRVQRISVGGSHLVVWTRQAGRRVDYIIRDRKQERIEDMITMTTRHTPLPPQGVGYNPHQHDRRR